MDFNDNTEEQSQNELNNNVAPEKPASKGPNLLKNRNQHNSAEIPAGNDTSSEFVNDTEIHETDINYDNNSDPDEPTADFMPDNNDIPPEPETEYPFNDSVSENENTSYENYSNTTPFDDEDSETSVVSEIEEIETDAPPDNSFSTIEQVAEDPEPYNPDKISADAAMGEMQPLKLNRTMILSIILGFFVLSFLFISFILPVFQAKKAEKTAQRKRLEQTSPTDYSLYAQRNTATHNADDDSPYDEDIDDVFIPDPLDYRHAAEPQPERREPPPPAYTGTGSGSERPDTRNDRLQAKSITGIKGLSSSRQNYNYAPLNTAADQFQNPNNPYAQFGLPPRDEYTRNMINAYTHNSAGGNSYTAQNNQGGKLEFMNQGRENAGNGQWLPINSVWQGTIFEATLTSNINTDLPGECTAWITKNVYSSLDGTLLLIPQNSRLLGSYNSSISYAQSRVQIGWHTLIRPDGYMINLGNMQATDPQGAAGLKGFINDHPFAYLKALGLLTALNLVNSQIDSNMANTENQYVQNVLANSQEMANRMTDKIIDRALDIQPTIIIRSGMKINIVVNNNLVLPPLTPYGVTQPYHRGE